MSKKTEVETPIEYIFTAKLVEKICRDAGLDVNNVYTNGNDTFCVYQNVTIHSLGFLGRMKILATDRWAFTIIKRLLTDVFEIQVKLDEPLYINYAKCIESKLKEYYPSFTTKITIAL
jgi:hypothetical protein